MDEWLVQPVKTRQPLPRIAVIGCGAAAQEFCFPVLARYPLATETVVAVDVDAKRAAEVAARWGFRYAADDYRQLPIEIDAAMITSPHHLHAEQSLYFLRQGKPVFVEKPIGVSVAEVDQLVAAAGSQGVPLMTNHCRRLFPAYRQVKAWLQSDEIGPLRKIRISDGSPFDWNSVSAFYLRDSQRAKGVLLDRGAHTLDLICWWLDGQPAVVEAWTDAHGGAEGLVRTRLRFAETEIELVLSRYYKLNNSYTLEGERGSIQGRLFHPARLELIQQQRRQTVVVAQPALYHEYAWRLVENFIGVVQGIESPLFTAAAVVPAMSLIDQLYRAGQPLSMPWFDDDPNVTFLQQQIARHSG